MKRQLPIPALGRLLDHEDCPENLQELLAIEWDHPNCDSPEHLLRVSLRWH
ncbi:hypothetical protein [Rhodopirellula sp. SWK7]|uniref:hypothetical protein n=1 Tax=Rhodopirellula sp. SWK7 TaxID=595460 RepID=UPI000346FE07|nr:hypothetical protein [Rhodopirellula sp. SWK7]